MCSASPSRVVSYAKNGVVFYTSQVAPSYPVVFAATLESSGSTVDAVTFEAGTPAGGG
jgi:hypothetical protein